MLNLKKTAVAVLALGSSAVFAGTMGPVCTPGNVTVPCERTAWDFGVQALYLEPVSESFAGFRTTSAGNTRFDEFDRNWDWGFKLEGSYHFNTGNDININWYHFDNDTNHNHHGQTVFFGTPAVGADFFARVRVQPEWDAVNIEVGQLANFGEQKHIRFHAGAQYARVEDTIRARIAVAGVGDFGVRSESTFNGFGPRVGADLAYDFGNGLAVYGNGAGSILVGDSKFSFNDASSVLGFGSLHGSKTAIVPEVDAKLGATYTFALAQGDFSLDAGYMWVNYFDAVNSGFVQSNFALNGPYFGVKWVGNV